MATVARSAVIIKKGERVSYTRKGENIPVMKLQAKAFKKTIAKFLELYDSVGRLPNKDDLADFEKPKFLRKLMKKDDHALDVDQAWTKLVGMYSTPDQSVWLIRMKRDWDLDLLQCSESELKGVLAPYVAKRAQKLQYINRISSEVRNVFRAIGRDHAYGDGSHEHSVAHEVDHVPLVFTGNPMTTATQDYMSSQLKRRVGDKKITSEHHGPAVSLPVAIGVIAHFLAKLTKTLNVNQVSRPRNLAEIVCMYAILIHEGGARGVETTEHLTYENIFLPLHTKVSIFVLPFLKPATLNTLLASNVMTNFVFEPFKGKFMQDRAPREKAVIPFPQNFLDLPTLLTLAFKVCLFVTGTLPNDDPESLTILARKSTDISSYNNKQLKNTSYEGVSPYGIRYACAAEDEKAKIRRDWRQDRMGHTKTSQMADRYARDEGVATFAGESLPLGVESDKLPMEYVSTRLKGVSYQSDWLEKQSEDIAADMRLTVELVDKYLAAPGKDTFEPLVRKFKEEHKSLDDCKMPIGFGFKFASKASTPEFEKTFKDNVDIITKSFVATEFEVDDVPIFGKIVREISIYPQIVYGNWREDETSKDTHKEHLDEHLEEVNEETLEENLEEVHEEVPEEVHEDDDPNEGGIFTWKEVTPGNHFVMLTNQHKDTCSFPLGEKYVWIGRFASLGVKKIKTENGYKKVPHIKAQFFRNKTRDIEGVLCLKSRIESVVAYDPDLLAVYEDDMLEQLSSDNIAELKEILGIDQ